LITLQTSDAVYQPVASQLQAVMVHPWKTGFELPDNCTAIAVGPGLAAPDVPEPLKKHVARLWQESRIPMVVDASALPWLPEGPCPQMSIRVLTPHPGEAAKMLGVSIPRVLDDRPAAVREISKRWGGSWVILKTHQTLISRGREEIYINSSGNSFLAQGGSGDVLTGFVAGLLAQPFLHDDALQLLRYAVWEHGAAADLLAATRAGWTVENLAEAIGSIRARRH
jgi:NAD(P)H-hydrate epimerase